MKLSNLLASRQAILRQAHLANLAYCYIEFRRLADRLAAAKLHVRVRLHQADGNEERDWTSLTALDGNQSVIEEHFDDKDILLLADGIAFALGGDFRDLEFSLADLGEKYVTPLRSALDRAGVIIDPDEQLAGPGS